MSTCKITINAKEYRCAFTMLQMENMSKLIKQQDSDVAMGACLPYSAIQMAARQDKTELDVTFEDVLLWFDTGFTEQTDEYKSFDAAYKDSTYYKNFVKPLEKASEDEKKSQ